jgi:hypothetical protein
MPPLDGARGRRWVRLLQICRPLTGAAEHMMSWHLFSRKNRRCQTAEVVRSARGSFPLWGRS